MEKKIKILMLVTFFAPDSCISAVRPSAITRYIDYDKFEVIVIRSGRISGKPDETLNQYLNKIRVISYDGQYSDAEKYKRNEYISNGNPFEGNAHFTFLKSHAVRKALHWLYDPVQYLRYAVREKKKITSVIRNELQQEQFDVVFASFGDIGNALAARKVADFYKCKLILDLRDPISSPLQSSLLRFITGIIQKKVTNTADLVTCVAKGLTKEISKITKTKVEFLPNGFVPIELEKLSDENLVQRENRKLTFFYGGDLYKGRRDLSSVFEAIRELIDEGRICISSIKVIYAGGAYQYLSEQASKYDLVNIIENHGYVSRKDVMELQAVSDIFLVATWNTIKEQGVLTGKFYESIQNNMPVIATVVGDMPGSEIGEVISEYNLGVCYEVANHATTFQLLKKYIENAYQQKMISGKVEYAPQNNPNFRFSYKAIARDFECIVKKLLK